MEDSLFLYFPGSPIQKMRPRFSFRGTYDLQTKVKENCLQLLKDQEVRILEGPLSMNCTFTIEIPKSFSKKKKRELLGTPHIKRPDLDNFIKFYLDLLNGIAYVDDAQICKITASKFYGECPTTSIWISSYVSTY